MQRIQMIFPRTWLCEGTRMVNTQRTSELHLRSSLGSRPWVVTNPHCCFWFQTVMNAVFKLLVHKYVKHLVKVRQAKLMKLWRTDVCQTLRDDARLLRNVMKDLVRFS